jgi:hypothetical protein
MPHREQSPRYRKPIEGWTWDIAGTVRGGGDVFFYVENVPARSTSGWLPAPTVTQPNGPGTLPIKFVWPGDGNGMWEIVTCPTRSEVDHFESWHTRKQCLLGWRSYASYYFELMGRHSINFGIFDLAYWFMGTKAKLSSCGAPATMFVLARARSGVLLFLALIRHLMAMEHSSPIMRGNREARFSLLLTRFS